MSQSAGRCKIAQKPAQDAHRNARRPDRVVARPRGYAARERPPTATTSRCAGAKVTCDVNTNHTETAILVAKSLATVSAQNILPDVRTEPYAQPACDCATRAVPALHWDISEITLRQQTQMKDKDRPACW